MWSAKFVSKARKKKFYEILTGTKKVHFKDENNKSEEASAKEKLKDEALDNHISSMEDKVAFNQVNQAKTDMLKNGCATTM